MDSRKPLVRCAIYTRKSHEDGLDQHYNSLDAQRDAAEAYIRAHLHENWVLIPDDYTDAAISGGTMKRPALQRLIQDIKQRKVDMVVVYKMDRLTRSLFDFAKIAQLMQTYETSFASVTEKIDTSTAMGKLHLNMLLSFAQFERELAGERIRDKVAASKQKGYWLGGHPPLGYDVKDKELIVNQDEAKTIVSIFENFLMTQSVTSLTEELQSKGITTKTFVSRKGELRHGKPITPSVLNYMLRNPIYIGKIRHKGNLYDGRHDRIISQALWDDVQALFKVSVRHRAKPRVTGTASPLNGIVKCSCCDSALVQTHTRKKGGKMYRYFTPSARRRRVCKNCTVGHVPAGELEKMVLDVLKNLSLAPDILTQIWQELVDSGMNLTEDDLKAKMTNFDAMFEQLFPVQQQRLVQLFVQKVVVMPGAADVHIRTDGIEDFVRDLYHQQRKENKHGDSDESREPDGHHPRTLYPKTGGRTQDFHRQPACR
jgi:DNA invertase Pin-like site-specific DNA recombinase